MTDVYILLYIILLYRFVSSCLFCKILIIVPVGVELVFFSMFIMLIKAVFTW